MTIADLTPLQGGPFSWDVPGVEYLFRVMSTIVVVLRPYFGWYERKSAACFLHVFFFHPGKPSRTPADEGRTTRGIGDITLNTYGVETPGSVLQPQRRGKDHPIKALSSKRLYGSPTPVGA
jgi:hypothetical protein